MSTERGSAKGDGECSGRSGATTPEDAVTLNGSEYMFNLSEDSDNVSFKHNLLQLKVKN